MAIRLTQTVRIDGVDVAADSVISTLTVSQQAELVRQRVAVWEGANLSGAWQRVPSIFRLRLVGTGMVSIDSRTSAGVEKMYVAQYAVTAATDQVEYPYLGEAAVEMRVTATGDVAWEVI